MERTEIIGHEKVDVYCPGMSNGWVACLVAISPPEGVSTEQKKAIGQWIEGFAQKKDCPVFRDCCSLAGSKLKTKRWACVDCPSVNGESKMGDEGVLRFMKKITSKPGFVDRQIRDGFIEVARFKSSHILAVLGGDDNQETAVTEELKADSLSVAELKKEPTTSPEAVVDTLWDWPNGFRSRIPERQASEFTPAHAEMVKWLPVVSEAFILASLWRKDFLKRIPIRQSSQFVPVHEEMRNWLSVIKETGQIFLPRSGTFASWQIKNRAVFGGRCYRLEWPGGSSEVMQLFKKDAIQMAVDKAAELGSPNGIRLIKVTLKDESEREVKWRDGQEINPISKSLKKLPAKALKAPNVPDTRKVVENIRKREGLTFNIDLTGHFSFGMSVSIKLV